MNITLNDFKGESNWNNNKYNKDTYSRYNAKAVMVDDCLTTDSGKRSVYLDFPVALSSGKVTLNFKALSPKRGIGFIFSVGNDGRNPVEYHCNQELNDTILLHIDVKYEEVWKCNSSSGWEDMNLLTKLSSDNFRYSKWYDVQFIFDYDRLNSSLDKELEEWVNFKMVDSEGTVLVEKNLTHLAQCVSTSISQFRINVKRASLIKDLDITVEESKLRLKTLKKLGTTQDFTRKTISIIDDSENIKDLTEQTLIDKYSKNILVNNEEIIVPKYLYKEPVTSRFITFAEHANLMKKRIADYSELKNLYKNEQALKYTQLGKLKPYNYGMSDINPSMPITTNDFYDKDTLMDKGYRCIYIGHKDSVSEYPDNYGTFEGRNIYVIPENDYNRCTFLCDTNDSINKIIETACGMYKEPIVITFLDGNYQFDITSGSGTDEDPYRCVELTRDNVIIRTFDFNTNFTLRNKSKVQNNESLLFFDTRSNENISITNFNYFLEDFIVDTISYNYPELSESTQTIINYVNSLSVYPSLNDICNWLNNGLPEDVINFQKLKADNLLLNQALNEALTLLAEVHSDDSN